MRILGVRAAPKEVSFVVYCNERNELLITDVVKTPLTLEMPERLKYFRNNILDILREFSIERAVIRVSEASSQNLNIERLYIEAVIQEAFSSSNISTYRVIRKSGICSKTGITAAEFKTLLDDKIDFRGIVLSAYDQNTIEAILAALSARD
ncbi:hypothetical protein [Ewingella americana]